jgi:lipopolysaccharide cholinephosphotransferase
MTIDNLKRVQDIGLEILIVVDQICKKNNIDYYLFYGTLLGCIRHGGSIPWDGDVDIAMTRENYLKFNNIVNKEIDSSKYVVKLMGSGSPNYVTEIKIGKRNTILCMPGTENCDIMNHVQLDIFCIDPAKIYKKGKRELLLKLWGFLRIIKLNYSEKQLLKIVIDKSSKKNKWLYKLILNISHLLRFIIGEQNIEKIGYCLFVDKTKKSNYYVVAGEKDVWNKDDFKKIEKEYEGIMFPIPSGWDNILHKIYGDYMQYPPEDKRYGKHFSEFIFKEY